MKTFFVWDEGAIGVYAVSFGLSILGYPLFSLLYTPLFVDTLFCFTSLSGEI